MPEIIIFFLLFVLPVIFWPFGPILFETPKVLIAEILIEALIISYFLPNTKDILKVLPKKQVLTILGIFLLSLIDLVLFPGTTTFLGNAFRLQGTFLLWNLLAFSLISGAIPLPKRFRWLTLSLFGLLALLAWLVGGNGEGRIIGSLGEPNSLAGVVIYLWPLVFLKVPRKRLTRLVGLLITITIILFSGSRSALIAFMIQFMFMILSQKFIRSYLFAALFALLLLATSLILPFAAPKLIYESRAEVWQTALASGFEQPLLGHGFGNIEQSLHQTSLRLGNNIQYQYVDSSHNIFLDFWVEGGLIGLGLFCYLLFNVFQDLIKRQSIIQLTMMLGLLTVLSFNPVSVCILIAFWWLICQYR